LKSLSGDKDTIITPQLIMIPHRGWEGVPLFRALCRSYILNKWNSGTGITVVKALHEAFTEMKT